MDNIMVKVPIVYWKYFPRFLLGDKEETRTCFCQWYKKNVLLFSYRVENNDVALSRVQFKRS